MKKTILALFSCGWLSAFSAVIDSVAAQVDDVTITMSDVMDEIRRRPPSVQPAPKPGETEMQALYREALEGLVDRRLILNAAAAKKMELQEWVVDNRIREIVKDGFGGDRNRLNAALESWHVTIEEWRQTVREDLIVGGMRAQTIGTAVDPTPAQMQAEYRNHPERYARTANVSVAVILLKPADPAETNQVSVSTRAEEILGRLDAGDDFGVLARRYSSDSHAPQGGLWEKIVPSEQFRPEIAAEIEKIKVGDYSRLLMLDGWGFIVKKTAEQTAAHLSFADAYDAIAREVRAAELRKRYDEWMKRLRADAFVKIYPSPAW